MTKRQRMLGVTMEAYEKGIIKGEFLANWEAFLAKAATTKKGEYNGIDITRMWFGEDAGFTKHEQVKPFWFGLTAIMPEHFNYTDTCGLDCLTVK